MSLDRRDFHLKEGPGYTFEWTELAIQRGIASGA